jgi:hypothetical protein
VVARDIAQQATEVDETTVEVAMSLFRHVEDQINRSDTKAQVVLAADAILLGWFGMQPPTTLPAMLAGHVAVGGQASVLCSVLVFVSLFLSVACGLAVIWPRSSPSPDSSLVYFGAIARRNESDYVAAFLAQSQRDLAQGLLAGVHAKARVANHKFRWVRLSVAFLLLALLVVTALGAVHVALS